MVFVSYSYKERRSFAKQFTKNERRSYKKGKKYGIVIGLHISQKKKQKKLDNFANEVKIDNFAKALKQIDLDKGQIRQKNYYVSEAKKLNIKK